MDRINARCISAVYKYVFPNFLKNMKGENEKMKKKTVALLLALVLVFGAAVGGTIAYLMDSTDSVTNTFTVGKVDIDLYETKDGKHVTGNAYQLIPGTTYAKDPTVTVTADSEDCYLFVKFEEKNNAAKYLNYTSNLKTPDWTRGDGTNIPADVWYRVVNKDDTKKTFNLLAGNDTYTNGCITVNGTTVTNESMNTAKTAELVYTAYAIQKANFDSAADAWAAIPKA